MFRSLIFNCQGPRAGGVSDRMCFVRSPTAAMRVASHRVGWLQIQTILAIADS